MVQKCKFPGKSATIRNVLGLKSQIVTILGILSAKIYDWLIRYWFKHLHPVFSAHGSICTSATEESQNQVHNQFKMTHRPPRGSFLFHCFFWPPKKNLHVCLPNHTIFNAKPPKTKTRNALSNSKSVGCRTSSCKKGRRDWKVEHQSCCLFPKKMLGEKTHD